MEVIVKQAENEIVMLYQNKFWILRKVSPAPIVLNFGFGSQTTVLNFGLGSRTT